MNQVVGKITKPLAEKIYQEAHEAGIAAGYAKVPTPMLVGSAIGLSDEIDYSQPTYVISGGVCGFAWVNISPARGAFVNYLKEINAGHKGYYGGYEVWVREFGQSYEQKMAYAGAFAKVLQEYGINAYSGGRLD